MMSVPCSSMKRIHGLHEIIDCKSPCSKTELAWEYILCSMYHFGSCRLFQVRRLVDMQITGPPLPLLINVRFTIFQEQGKMPLLGKHCMC